jgi:putative nucleotidyltransferase with HDIG domain
MPGVTAKVYIWLVAACGIGLWLALLAMEPRPDGSTLFNLAIFLVLTILSSISPIRTRGGVVSVASAPMFGAMLLLSPGLAATVAGLGTIDERIPGRRISWDRFFFNRGINAGMVAVPSLIFHPHWPRPPEQWSWALAAADTAALAAMIIINILLVAGAVALLQQSSYSRALGDMVSGNLGTFVALSVVGLLAAYIVSAAAWEYRFVVFLLFAPLLIYRASMRKQVQLDSWIHESFIMQSRVIDKRDGQTFGHSQRVGELCEAVARELRVSEELANRFRMAGVLHDLGKIAIPDTILLKPAKLTAEEYELIKTHAREGAEILFEHEFHRPVGEIILCHHEKWDGTGYPQGLKGEEIPLGARIISVCDSYDTMTRARIFRPTVKSPLVAAQELRDLSGSWYDPAVVEAMIVVLQKQFGVDLSGLRAVPQAPPLPTFAEVLAHRDFRRLWLGQAISYFGDIVSLTGLGILTYLITGSAQYVVIAFLARALPTAVFGILAGPVVDRFDRKRTMIWADLLRAVLAISIPLFAFSGHLWLVFASVFFSAAASAFFQPAKLASVPNLLPPRLLMKGNALISASEKAIEIAGYAAAGLIALWSVALVFFIDAATFFLSAAMIIAIALPAMAHWSKASFLGSVLGDIRAGVLYLARQRALTGLTLLTLAATILATMIFPLIVVLAYQLDSGGFPKSEAYSLLLMAVAVGALVGTFAAPRAAARLRSGVAIVLGLVGMGVGLVTAGVTPFLWIAVLAMLVSGFANMIYYVPAITATQEAAEDRFRGRVMAGRSTVIQIGFLVGLSVGGLLSVSLGTARVFVVSGSLLIVTGLVALMIPFMRNIGGQRAVQPGEAFGGPVAAAK